MIYPIPAVMVSVTDGKGQDDIITVAWTGTICTNPPMAYISVRPERFSYHMIKEAPVSIECRVKEIRELGSHHMFLAEVTGVSVDEQWLNERGSLELAKAEPIVYSHGGYYGLSELLGTFGWSVKKKKRCQR